MVLFKQCPQFLSATKTTSALLGVLVVLAHGDAEHLMLAGKSRVHELVSAAHLVHLRCKPSVAQENLSIEWFKNGIKLHEDDRRPFGYEMRRWSLKLPVATPSDNGDYTCVVFNKFQSVNKTFELEVLPRQSASHPIIKHGQPRNETVLIGANVTLRCDLEDTLDASTESHPYIEWLRHLEVNESYRDDEGVLLTQTLQFCAINGPCWDEKRQPYYIDDPRTYTFINVSLSSSGLYTCKVNNYYGYDFATANLTVVPFFPTPEPRLMVDGNRAWMASFGVGTALAILATTAIMALLLIKLRRERASQKAATSALSAVYRCSKLVNVERSMCSSLLAPRVSIERVRMHSSASTQRTFLDADTDYEFQSDPAWEISRDRLTMGPVVGEGAFGKVVKAHISEKSDHDESKALMASHQGVVAVKMLKDTHSEQDVIDLVQEAEIMKGRHPNIINLLGVCSQPVGKPLLLIVEYAEYGNLKSVLLQQRRKKIGLDNEGYQLPISNDNLLIKNSINPNVSTPRRPELKFAREQNTLFDAIFDQREMLTAALHVSRGMHFLSSRHCVHRDLAARNILVASNRVYKIADFGLARDVHCNDYYRKNSSGRLPIKWMAPESVFERICTSKSDVYSYGILLWEISSLGESPFNELDIELFMQHLREGVLLPKPPDCTEDFFRLMRQCWQREPDDRPHWEQIVLRVQTLLLNTLRLVESEGLEKSSYSERVAGYIDVVP